ncbi:hypothetical protein BIW11_05689, partial [Tropilaelaps mercedesae]
MKIVVTPTRGAEVAPLAIPMPVEGRANRDRTPIILVNGMIKVGVKVSTVVCTINLCTWLIGDEAEDEAVVLIEETVATSQTQQLLFNTTEPEIFRAGVASTPREPFWFLGAIEKTKVASKNLSALASVTESATRDIAQNLNLSPRDVTFGLTKVDTKRTFLEQNCPYHIGVRACAPERYRNYDGFCNNIENPYWGSANLRYLRFLPPSYAD